MSIRQRRSPPFIRFWFDQKSRGGVCWRGFLAPGGVRPTRRGAPWQRRRRRTRGGGSPNPANAVFYALFPTAVPVAHVGGKIWARQTLREMLLDHSRTHRPLRPLNDLHSRLKGV